MDAALDGLSPVTDCGVAMAMRDDPADPASAVLRTCVAEALEAGDPLRATLTFSGVDSEIATFYVSAGGGVLDVLRWDSAPCGGRTCIDCAPALGRARCANPTFAANDFECEPDWQYAALCDGYGAFFPDGVFIE